jgi:hypothetical protein
MVIHKRKDFGAYVIGINTAPVGKTVGSGNWDGLTVGTGVDGKIVITK